MAEGTLMETLIAGGAVVVVVGAIMAILYRITMGERSTRNLEKLKEELEKSNPAGKAPPPKK